MKVIFTELKNQYTVKDAGSFTIEFSDANGTTKILKDNSPLKAGEIIDSSVMNMNKLKAFIATQIDDAKAKGVLFSVHLKATMMKVSDPIIIWCFCRSIFQRCIY